MKKSLQFGLALAMLTTPALADKFSGQYTVTFYGPHHQQQGSVCYAFTPKGQTAPGFPNSGTWVQVNGIIDGVFVVTGHDLHFFGSTSNGMHLLSYAFHVNLRTGKGDFDEWISDTLPIQAEDDGTILFAAGC